MSNSGPEPPHFLANAPKSVIKALDTSEALQAALTAATDDPAAYYGPVVALHQIQSYLDAAKRQRRRIERNRASTHRVMREGRRRPSGGFFADVHFYLICWARIYKSASFILTEPARLGRNAPKFGRLGLVLSRYRSELVARRDARDHLEHFEERLKGKWGKKNPNPKNPNDLLNMANEFLTFGGRKLDVGPNSIRLLTEIVAQFQLAVLYDSLEALETKDQRRLSGLLQRAGRDMSVARVVRRAKRMLGGKA